jgi:hypothetical protein
MSLVQLAIMVTQGKRTNSQDWGYLKLCLK